MVGLVALCFAIFLALSLVTAARGTLRLKLIRDRADAICGIASELPGAPKNTTIDAHIGSVLETFGLSAENRIGRAYLLLGPLTLGVVGLWAGWKAGIAVILMLGIAYLAIAKWQDSKRTRAFADRLPVFLERVRRLVMIGNTLPQAFVEAVSTADPVIKSQIDPFVRRIRYGASFSDSIEMLAQQSDVAELHLLSAYVKTNAKFGGRVAQTLSTLIDQLSNKRRLEREIRAATAETRASAAILCGLMIFMMLIMSVMNPQYVAFFFGSDQGRLILIGIAIWPLIGIAVMRRILMLDF